MARFIYTCGHLNENLYSSTITSHAINDSLLEFRINSYPLAGKHVLFTKRDCVDIRVLCTKNTTEKNRERETIAVKQMHHFILN